MIESGWAAGGWLTAAMLGIYLLWRLDAAEPQPVAPGEVAEFQDEMLARLERQERLLEQMTRRLVKMETAGTPAGAESGMKDAISPAPGYARATRPANAEAEFAAAQARAREETEHLDRRWADEAPDHEWEAAQEQDLREQISAVKLESGGVSDIRCKATLCRLVVDGSEYDAEQLSLRLGRLAAFQNTEFRTSSEGEGQRLVVHLARPGHSLVPPDQKP